MTLRHAVTVMFLAAVCAETHAFLHVGSVSGYARRTAETAMSASAGTSRSESIAAAGSGVLAAGVVLGSGATQVAAEVEMKDEVQQFEELRGGIEKKGRDEVAKENLSVLTDATSGIKTLGDLIGKKDYQAVRLALRNPPIGNLRTSARKVIINLSDKDAEEKATAAYKALISSVDKLDNIANRGMKEKEGLKEKDDKELSDVFADCVAKGADLLTALPKFD